MKKKQIDHLGNEFDSIAKMLDYWSVSRSKYDWGINNGLSIKEILTKRGKYNSVSCNGSIFKSEYDFARYLKVNTVSMNKLLKSKTPEQIYKLYSCNVVINGKKIDRIYDVAKEFDIQMNSIIIRLNNGETLNSIIDYENKVKEIIELTDMKRSSIAISLWNGETYESIKKKHCIDLLYNGKRFYNLKSLSEELGIPLSILASKVKSDKDLKHLVRMYSPVDYDGVTYKNYKELYLAKGKLNYSMYLNILKKNHTLEEALGLSK